MYFEQLLSRFRAILPEQASELAYILALLGSGVIAHDTAQTLIRENAKHLEALKLVAGKQFNSPDAIISFGDRSNMGDITIHEVAGGNIIHIHINSLHTPSISTMKSAAKQGHAVNHSIRPEIYWEQDKVELWNKFEGLPSYVQSLAFSDDNSLLAIGCQAYIKIISLESKMPQRIIEPESSRSHYCLAFSKQGNLLASSGYDTDNIVIYDTSSGEVVSSFKFGDLPYVGPGVLGSLSFRAPLSFLNNDKWIGASTGRGFVRIWDIHSNSLVSDLQGGHGITKNAIGTLFACGTSYKYTDDATIKVWHVKDLSLANKVTIPSSNKKISFEALKLTEDNKIIVVSKAAETYLVFDALSGEQMYTGSIPTKTLFSSFSATIDARIIASHSRAGQFTIISTKNGRVLHTISEHKGYIYALQFSPNGLYLATGGEDRSVKLWVADSKEEA